MSWLHDFAHWIVQFVEHLGYFGIFVMTFVESTFIPIPSEITMVPAGYLIEQGKMHFVPVMIASISGTVAGALFNYWIAVRFGRQLFIDYGKYFFMTEKKLAMLEEFFLEHGAISTFTGRLIPGLRHYIAFPAGLARMKLRLFIIYTSIGGGLWMLCLVALGYYMGENEKEISRYVARASWSMVALVGLMVGFYVWHFKRRRKAKTQALVTEVVPPPTGEDH